jgi:RimJ/RimL family protein N-acetyltransferase
VSLRPFRPGDAARVTEACQDPLITRWTEVPDPYRHEDAEGWIAAQGDARATGEALELAVVAAGADAVDGAIGLVNLAPEHARGEVGYWIAPWARRGGLATHAVRLLAGWALDDLGLGRLELLTHTDNEISGRVAVAAGFRREGVLRAYRVSKGRRVDLVMYARVAGD